MLIQTDIVIRNATQPRGEGTPSGDSGFDQFFWLPPVPGAKQGETEATSITIHAKEPLETTDDPLTTADPAADSPPQSAQVIDNPLTNAGPPAPVLATGTPQAAPSTQEDVPELGVPKTTVRATFEQLPQAETTRGDASLTAAFKLHSQDIRYSVPVKPQDREFRSPIPNVLGDPKPQAVITDSAATTLIPTQPSVGVKAIGNPAPTETGANAKPAVTDADALRLAPVATNTFQKPMPMNAANAVLAARIVAPTSPEVITARALAEKSAVEPLAKPVLTAPPMHPQIADKPFQHIKEVQSPAKLPDPPMADRNTVLAGGITVSTTPVPNNPTPASAAPPHPHPAQQLVFAVASAVRQGQTGQIEITLRPEELGQLRFEMTTRGEKIHVIIAAERTEALDLLRRNAEQFMTDLRQSGFAQASFSFGNWRGRERADPPKISEDDLIDMAAPMPLSLGGPLQPPLPTGHGRLDIRL